MAVPVCLSICFVKDDILVPVQTERLYHSRFALFDKCYPPEFRNRGLINVWEVQPHGCRLYIAGLRDWYVITFSLREAGRKILKAWRMHRKKEANRRLCAAIVVCQNIVGAVLPDELVTHLHNKTRLV